MLSSLASLSQRRTLEKDAPLDPDFEPGPHDVICTRGKEAYNHPGNVHFRTLIYTHWEDYNTCITKIDKSLAVIRIVDEIRQLSPQGGFVKFCKQKRCYVEVGDKKAREKVGHALRELTGSRSSTPSDDTSVASKSDAKMAAEESGSSSSSSHGKTSKSVAETVKMTPAKKTVKKKSESCNSSSDGKLPPEETEDSK